MWQAWSRVMVPTATSGAMLRAPQAVRSKVVQFGDTGAGGAMMTYSARPQRFELSWARRGRVLSFSERTQREFVLDPAGVTPTCPRRWLTDTSPRPQQPTRHYRSARRRDAT